MLFQTGRQGFGDFLAGLPLNKQPLTCGVDFQKNETAVGSAAHVDGTVNQPQALHQFQQLGFYVTGQFGGFDHSVLIDIGWRMVSGQRPGLEFQSTLPIGFVIGSRYAFRIFGLTWSAIIAWQACFVVITCCWSFALLRRLGESPARAALLSLALQASANLVTSYWWYNPATTTAGVLFFLSAAAFWRQPGSLSIGASYIASLVMLAGMKPNVAGVLILGVTLTLVSSPPHRRRTIVYSVLAFALFTGWLALEGVWLIDVLRSYLSISGRGFSFAQFLQDSTVREKQVALLLMAASLAPWVVALLPPHRASRPRIDPKKST